ncbi:MAG: oligosaccharide flippase family protein [Candidatus Levybacteria bacterium]|nr:oligosaccharide flippase family protein [Candidatus Levybacteria bacterium]
MPDIFKRGLGVLMQRQTNIVSAAYIIMATIIFSQILGVFKMRLLFSIFGASTTLGIFNYATILPDTVFQLTLASALTSAFIPVFSEYIAKGDEQSGHKMASAFLSIGLIIFFILSILLAIFAENVLTIFNLATQFSQEEMTLMANLMRIILIGQALYIIGAFFTALLQSYNHFFIPGIAAALYNVGLIIGIILFHQSFGIYAAPLGIILGGLTFIIFQVPLAKKVGFFFRPSLSYLTSTTVRKILLLTWPRAVQVAIQQFGTVTLAALIAFMADPGRMNLLFDSAKTLMFAPVALIGYSIAQAAFPVLAKEKDKIEEFKITFMTSFNQLLYLILPISAIILVLRIPIVRLAYGADKFDWEATVLTGQTLAFFSFSIFAQALIVLLYRAFYALHNAKIPFIASGVSTLLLVILSYLMVIMNATDIRGIAIAFSAAGIFQLFALFIILDYKTGGFPRKDLFVSMVKFFIVTVSTALALYLPIKLLDQLVFDTTRTINLVMLTGISTIAGLSLYVFLTWLLNIKEATTYLLILRKIGNWQEILRKTDTVIEPAPAKP